jgi:hypothetical protein
LEGSIWRRTCYKYYYLVIKLVHLSRVNHLFKKNDSKVKYNGYLVPWVISLEATKLIYIQELMRTTFILQEITKRLNIDSHLWKIGSILNTNWKELKQVLNSYLQDRNQFIIKDWHLHTRSIVISKSLHPLGLSLIH